MGRWKSRLPFERYYGDIHAIDTRRMDDVISTHVYPTVCFGTHRDVLCFGVDYIGGELIYLFAQFFIFFQICCILLTQLACSRLGNPAVAVCGAVIRLQ